MAALRSVLSRQKVNSFCAVGSELLNGPVCLSRAVWEVALDDLETARCNPSVLPPLDSLSVQSISESVRHYHAVYARCVQLLVVPLHRWRQWHEGLCFFIGESGRDETGGLAALCRQLMVSQRECFAVAFWGCWSSVAVRLESLSEQIASQTLSAADDGAKNGNDNDDDATVSGDAENDDVVDKCIVRLRKRYFLELYQFQRLAHDAAHLFNSYGLVGKAERQWLTDAVLLQHDEAAAEALLRRSFKRDFGVPCTELDSGVLFEEYKAFEVNERKDREMRKRSQETLKGTWCSRARDVSEHEMKQKQDSSQEHLCDDRGKEILDNLVECLRRNESKPDLAFAVTMCRIVEKEVFPASVNLARLEFALNLLQEWFETYANERHPGDIPLLLDADLWKFVLERHTELLKWAVMHYCCDDATVDPLLSIDAIMSVSFSVLHCLDVYLVSVVRKRTPGDPKKELEARQKVSNWVQQTVVNLFLSGVLNFCSESITTGSFSVAFITSRIAVAKAQLLILCDALSLAMDARQLLLPTIQPAFEEMGRLQKDADVADLVRWVMCMISVLSMLRRTLLYSTNVSDTPDELVLTLHGHYQTLQRLAPSLVANLVCDAWLDFMLCEGRRSGAGRRRMLLDITRVRCSLLEPCQSVKEGEKVVKQKRPREE
ncbi:hypothetical protein DQ04_00091240 [Trypanosoma grayi]|uniref:hypothetical protein n=1 Tax=Trypanosoma grayi TaxID=71804 RepID=UPI0004F44ECA|nr:hypothetical protein DQ04_00091240 [Trypanosoma grayi]KEG15390.1 hypothetical protein DQ04_00091240 [Trypanosoma grayi]